MDLIPLREKVNIFLVSSSRKFDNFLERKFLQSVNVCLSQFMFYQFYQSQCCNINYRNAQIKRIYYFARSRIYTSPSFYNELQSHAEIKQKKSN